MCGNHRVVETCEARGSQKKRRKEWECVCVGMYKKRQQEGCQKNKGQLIRTREKGASISSTLVKGLQLHTLHLEPFFKMNGVVVIAAVAAAAAAAAGHHPASGDLRDLHPATAGLVEQVGQGIRRAKAHARKQHRVVGGVAGIEPGFLAKVGVGFFLALSALGGVIVRVGCGGRWW